MTSIIAQKRRSFFPIPTSANNTSLPVSHAAAESSSSESSSSSSSSSKPNESAGGVLRRRLSSMSLKIQPNQYPSFPRSRSLSSMGDYAGTSIRKWWEWGWAWILSRKPVFARDLEMNEQETKILGSHDRGTWRHVFYKVRSEIRRLITSDHLSLPQTYTTSGSMMHAATSTTRSHHHS